MDHPCELPHFNPRAIRERPGRFSARIAQVLNHVVSSEIDVPLRTTCYVGPSGASSRILVVIGRERFGTMASRLVEWRDLEVFGNMSGVTSSEFRVERDSMGEMSVPTDALYGATTARAIENFPISGFRFTRPVSCARSV